MPETTQPDHILPQRKTVTITYTNWKGETGERTILPLDFFFGSTSYHPEEQWLLRAVDLDKHKLRTFALKDIQGWVPGVSPQLLEPETNDRS